jgi:isopenicillin N synthase-like dioxygenase
MNTDYSPQPWQSKPTFVCPIRNFPSAPINTYYRFLTQPSYNCNPACRCTLGKLAGNAHKPTKRQGFEISKAREIEINRMARPDFKEIPILDLSKLNAGSALAPASVADELCGYLENVGFVYIAGHGVPNESVLAVRESSHRFHALPLEEKLKLKLDRNFRGYIPINTSIIVTSTVAKVTKPNQSESLMIMHEVAADDPAALAGKPLQGPNQWPDESLIPNFRSTMETYVRQMTGLARTMIGLIATALEVPSSLLAPHFEKPTTFLRLLHYPPQPEETGLFGSAPHTDYGFITLLAQDDVGGLEVRNKSGEWIAAPPIPGTFVMNVGDILARWSNDRFVSTPHRVINRSGRERYSQPFFFDPSMDSLIEALPTCIGRDLPPKYEPVAYGDYLMERIDKNYQSRKTLVQAST